MTALAPSAAAPGSLSHVRITPSVETGIGAGGGVGGVAVLFAREDSIYKTMPGLDVYDRARDARTYRGPGPVVAHPPCRAWGCLRMMAKPRPGERELALWAVCMVRLFGGVLEHPAGSTLWPVAKLPEPGERDAWGGFTIALPQFWFGHQANKATRLYICGCGPGDVPEVPLVLGEAPLTMSSTRKELVAAGLQKKELLKKDREKTPAAMAMWLVELAGRAAGVGVGPKPSPTEAKENVRMSDGL